MERLDSWNVPSLHPVYSAGKKRLHLSVFKPTTVGFSFVPPYFNLLVCLLACLTVRSEVCSFCSFTCRSDLLFVYNNTVFLCLHQSLFLLLVGLLIVCRLYCLSDYLLSLYIHVYLWLKTCCSTCLIAYHLSFGCPCSCLSFNLSVLPINTCLDLSFWLSSRWYIRLHILTSLRDHRFLRPSLQLHRKSPARTSLRMRAFILSVCPTILLLAVPGFHCWPGVSPGASDKHLRGWVNPPSIMSGGAVVGLSAGRTVLSCIAPPGRRPVIL